MELTKEQRARLIPMREAAKLFRVGAGHAKVRSLHRWIKEGCKLRDGRVAVLKAVRLGHDLLTLPEWCEEFEQARYHPVPLPEGRPVARSARQAAREHREAEKYLDEAGCR